MQTAWIQVKSRPAAINNTCAYVASKTESDSPKIPQVLLNMIHGYIRCTFFAFCINYTQHICFEVSKVKHSFQIMFYITLVLCWVVVYMSLMCALSETSYKCMFSCNKNVWATWMVTFFAVLFCRAIVQEPELRTVNSFGEWRIIVNSFIFIWQRAHVCEIDSVELRAALYAHMLVENYSRIDLLWSKCSCTFTRHKAYKK